VARQYFTSINSPLQLASATQITGTAEADLLGAATNAAIPTPADIGTIFRLRAGGIMTTPASGATTIIVTPRWGTTTGGTSLGASAASATVGVSQTNVPWELDGTMVIRTLGATGTAIATVVLTVATGVLASNVVAGSNGSVTINTTTAGGFFIGVTLGGSASFTMTSQFCLLETLT
jgi:hypothetical protein